MLPTRSCFSSLVLILGTVWSSFPLMGEESAALRISFGHTREKRAEYVVHLLAGSEGLKIARLRGWNLEADDRLSDWAVLHAGARDIDGLEFTVQWPAILPTPPASFPFHYNGDAMWKYLFENGTPDQVRRLRDDPALTPGSAVLTVETASDGTRGFSIGLSQLLRHGALWLPGHDAYITLVDAPVEFAAHLASLEGERTLDRVRREPESTLPDFTNRWVDMGNPDAWSPPWETTWLGARGHIIPVAGKVGSIYKFGVDRWGNVRPDHASPHKFRLDVFWPGCRWEGQQLTDGLPVIVTRCERNGQQCEIEQFAGPRERNVPYGRGADPMLMYTRVALSGAAGSVQIGFSYNAGSPDGGVELREVKGHWCVVDAGEIAMTIEPGREFRVEPSPVVNGGAQSRVEFQVTGTLASGEICQVILKLASPGAPVSDLQSMAGLDFDRERAWVLDYWEKWLAQGAAFEVPEAKVNELFRANLWHALRLPRFRVEDGQDRIDLPYSNFAYGQLQADWPINQAVYVDYMLYGLRGHYAVAQQEFAAIYQTQQREDGRVSGYADWGVYTPSMLYAIGRTFLLSRDRVSFDQLLPASLRSMDWCLAQIARARSSPEAPGLIVAPLNDLTHDSEAWGFPNAYFVAGLSVFGRALQEYGHPRGAECVAASEAMRRAVEREFARASVHAPVVQLGDGTWNNYVPCAATLPHRLFEQWYPTDVDTGPMHLARLGVLDPRGWLTEAMLLDHEDNLYLKQWGAANEPVYNPQGTVYLLRDEPAAAIRTFYSTLACAFSQGQLEPVEHRWAWGQYFGPPSTDGAWFELYRNLLIFESSDGSLRLGQATPRRWLEDGQRIRIDRAPTYYGPVNLEIESRAARGEIRAIIELSGRNPPAVVLLRLRHPEGRPMRSVEVNGGDWNGFDREKEWIRLGVPGAVRYVVQARY